VNALHRGYSPQEHLSLRFGPNSKQMTVASF